CATIIGNTLFLERHLGQDLRRQKQGDEIIHGQHRQVTRRQEKQKTNQPQYHRGGRSGDKNERSRYCQDCEHENTSQICDCCVRTKPSTEAFRQRHRSAGCPLECQSSRVDQIIANVSSDFVRGSLCQRQRLTDDCLL